MGPSKDQLKSFTFYRLSKSGLTTSVYSIQKSERGVK